MNGKRVLDIYDKMVQERGSMPELWEEVIRYCFPQERRSYSAFGGDVRENGWRRANPVCSLPVILTQRLGSSIHSNAFPSNDYWFDFAVRGPAASDDMKRWCALAQETVHMKMRQGTNFYQESHALMVGLSALGTGGFYTYYKRGKLHFRYIPIHKNFYIASNADGEIDMVALLHQWTAKEAIEEYGRDRVGEEVRRAFDSDEASSSSTFDYIQLVYSKRTFGETYSVLKGDKPFGDITVEKDTGRVVRVSQHGRFPFATPRFFVYSDDLYGRSPAMNAIADIRALNALRKNTLDATVRVLKPPLFVNGLLGDVSIDAGAVNTVSANPKEMIMTFPLPTDLNAAAKLNEDLTATLRSAFFIDVFEAIEQQKTMTATEVTERVNQKVESISPIVTRIQSEFSSKVVLQCLDLLIEHGDLEPPPASAEGTVIRVDYISRLDAMIQQGVAAKTMNFISQIMALGSTIAQLPQIADTLNTDEIIKSLADANTLPASFFKRPSEVAAARRLSAQRQQAIDQANLSAAAAKQEADAAKARQLDAMAAATRGQIA